MLPQLRRTSFTAGTIACLSLIGGCQGQPDLEPLRTAVLVETPGAKLTGADFERWLMASPSRPIPNYSTWMISTWIDQELFAEAIAAGKVFEDSAMVVEAIWPAAERMAVRDFFIEHSKILPAVTDAQADSLDLTGHVRAFQQAVVMVADNAPEPALVAASERIRRLKAMVDAGEDFTKVVRQYSEDTISKKRDGYWTMAVDRDHVPGQIAGEVWSLERGMVSTPLATPIGYAIIRRVSAKEARPSLKEWLTPIFADREADRYRDSLRGAKHFTITKGALDRVRHAVVEPMAIEGDEPLVTWDGGSLSIATTRRWLAMYEADGRAEVALGSDGHISEFLLDISMSEALLPKIASSEPTAAAWKSLAQPYRDSLKVVKDWLQRLGGGSITPGMGTRVLDSLALANGDFKSLPGILEGVLRANATVKVDHKKIQEVFVAVDMAWQKLHANDRKEKADGSKP